MSDQPGMVSIYRHLDRTLIATWEDASLRLAREVRAEINGLWAAQNGPASARPGRKEQAWREARIEGMKWALALIMGMPPVGYQEKVDAFLEEFRAERMKTREKN